MRVLGFDPGSRACGYGAVDSSRDRLSATEFGVWRASAKALPTRLEFIFGNAERLLARLRPDAAAVESVFAGKSIPSAVALAQARGVLLLAAARAGVPIFEYEPLVVKKAVSGFGLAEKPQVRSLVRVILAVPEGALALDAADALAVAICHCHHAGNPDF